MLAEPWTYIDGETSPRVGTFPDIHKVKPPKNYRVEETIQRYKQENAYHHWAGDAKDRARAQVIITGIASEEGPVELFVTTNEQHMFDMLNDWWVAHNRPSTWCAYNGMGFDFWIYATRAAKYGHLDLAKSLMPKHPKYPDAFHKDPYMALGQEGKLDDWADFWLGTPRKVVVPWGWQQEILRKMKRPSTDELLPFELIGNGRPDLAEGKCREDVEMLRGIAKAMRAVNLL